jgi:hypothetical protein
MNGLFVLVSLVFILCVGCLGEFESKTKSNDPGNDSLIYDHWKLFGLRRYYYSGDSINLKLVFSIPELPAGRYDGVGGAWYEAEMGNSEPLDSLTPFKIFGLDTIDLTFHPTGTHGLKSYYVGAKCIDFESNLDTIYQVNIVVQVGERHAIDSLIRMNGQRPFRVGLHR